MSKRIDTRVHSPIRDETWLHDTTRQAMFMEEIEEAILQAKEDVLRDCAPRLIINNGVTDTSLIDGE